MFITKIVQHFLPLSTRVELRALNLVDNVIRGRVPGNRASVDSLYCTVDAFRGHPRQFPGLLDFSQFLLADGDFFLSDRPQDCFSLLLFFLFYYYFFFCEPASSAHTTTKFRHKLTSDNYGIGAPQAQRNSLQSALHRAAKCIQQYFVSTRQQGTTTQASRPEQALQRANIYE